MDETEVKKEPTAQDIYNEKCRAMQEKTLTMGDLDERREAAKPERPKKIGRPKKQRPITTHDLPAIPGRGPTLDR